MPISQPTKLAAYLRTDIGVVREHNEDSAFADPDGTFFIVADGMGGHAAGEVASSMAVEEVKKCLEQARTARIAKFAEAPTEEGRQELSQLLEEAVRQAHQSVFDRGAREPDKKGMGTTLDVVLIIGGEAFIAHVGDSRTYLLRSGSAAQITTDHTVAEVLVIEGRLSPDEARLSPLRTILVNALGVSADVGVELAHLTLRKDDKLLMCSDGLHDYFPLDNELAEVLVDAGPTGLERLVALAKERGGHDNITGILVEIEDCPSAEDELSVTANTANVRAPELPPEDALRVAEPASPGKSEPSPADTET